MIAENLTLAEKVEEVLDTMRPYLQADGGDVELLEIKDGKKVLLRLLGNCSNCQMSRMTMKAGIEEGIRKALPQIESVMAVNLE